ncbi:cupin domain-containing protein [Thermaerobacter composti]|uniref:Cupin domain-containing protein n=1 Tax=Thermaerobacter composti TaxID=554949 RepID=A0ABZ0QM04_9FIRM|nr:cupin domain-containing protein [Thermaerobacter composti]WPD18521.1 cupin domain-containing protein [Thermaerobacter composti]
MAKFIRNTDVPQDTKYERGLKIEFGINDATAGSTDITMGHTIIPAGSRNQRHYHACNACMYIIRGQLKVLIGDGDTYYEKEVGPGTFVYVPKGEIHGLINLSDTEDAELVFAYAGVPNKEAACTTFVDSVDVVERHLAAKGIKVE